MYQYNDLFDLTHDKVTYQYKNPFFEISYNQSDEPGAILNTSNSVPFFTFPSFKNFSHIKHGFSTRLGGVSEDMWMTLNLSFSRGDEKEHVIENYHRIMGSMGMKIEDIVFSDQVHDTIVKRVTREDCQGAELSKRKLVGIDGLVTNEKNVVLCTSYADCVPLFFVDEKREAIGLSHSGWKGTVGRIGAKTVEIMTEEFGTRPEDLHCVIGPSICANCYEVSEDVILEIENKISKKAAKECAILKPNGKYQLDLWLLNKKILLDAGVKEENIVISNVCTCCNHKILFSHRKSQGKRGNLCGFLSLI